MQSLLKFAVAMLLLMAGAPALAQWHEARSDHFRIYGSMKPDELADFALRLERFDKALRLMNRLEDDPSRKANPVTIYIVDSLATVRKMYGSGGSNIAGFYRNRLNSIAFSPKPKKGDKYDLSGEAVLLHEYAHHFMWQNFTAAYPVWFVEGFAEFHATAKFRPDGSIEFGGVPLYRGMSLWNVLKRRSALSLTRTLSTTLAGLSVEQVDTVYATGWLLTHFLTFNDARRGQLQDYLSRINAGASFDKAAEQAFGDVRTLEADMRAHAKGDRIDGLLVPVAKLAVRPPELRRLSAGEAAMMPIRMQSDRGVEGKLAAALVLDARRVAAPFPGDSSVQVWLAEAEYDAGNDDAAEAAADRALAADPSNRRALIYKARARIRRAEAAKTDSPEAWKEARSWLLKANRMENDDAEPLFLFYTSFLTQGAKPTANAVEALLGALHRAPQDEWVRMMAVHHYLEQGDIAAARRTVAPLAFSPHAGKGGLAARIVERIDAGDAGPTIAKLFDPEESDEEADTE